MSIVEVITDDRSAVRTTVGVYRRIFGAARRYTRETALLQDIIHLPPHAQLLRGSDLPALPEDTPDDRKCTLVIPERLCYFFYQEAIDIAGLSRATGDETMAKAMDDFAGDYLQVTLSSLT